MADFASAEYAAAFPLLRNAAFGFVDHIEKLQTIEAYAALAARRLGHDEDALDALERIVAAEKVEPHFRSVKLSDDLRLEFNKAAAWLLPASEAALLGVPSALIDAATAAKPRVLVPMPSKRPNVPITVEKGKAGSNDKGDTAPPGGKH